MQVGAKPPDACRAEAGDACRVEDGDACPAEAVTLAGQGKAEFLPDPERSEAPVSLPDK